MRSHQKIACKFFYQSQYSIWRWTVKVLQRVIPASPSHYPIATADGPLFFSWINIHPPVSLCCLSFCTFLCQLGPDVNTMRNIDFPDLITLEGHTQHCYLFLPLFFLYLPYKTINMNSLRPIFAFSLLNHRPCLSPSHEYTIILYRLLIEYQHCWLLFNFKESSKRAAGLVQQD